jgi:hypothetical protein
MKLMKIAILTLPERFREAVVLCDLQEMSYADAASITGCPEGTIRSRLHRGRKMLLHKLNDRLRRQPDSNKKEEASLASVESLESIACSDDATDAKDTIDA